MFFNFNVNFFLSFFFVNVSVLFRNLEITDQSFNIVDIKPENMEELTEVITASCFHPTECNLFMYSSSRGCIKLGTFEKKSKVEKAESVVKALVVTGSCGFDELSLVTANIVVATFCVEFNIAMVTVTGAVVDAESVVMCVLSESMASLEDSMI